MRRWLIGIAGPSGSGKSAVAAALAGRLPDRSPVVVALDDYYRDLSGLEPALRGSWNFDDPASLDHELLIAQVQALAAGEPVERPVYRFETHSRAPTTCRTVPGHALILDGLFCLHWPTLRNRLDARIFLDASQETCLRRRIRRDVHQRGRTPEQVREQFRRTVVPMFRRHVEPTRAFAHLVLDGEQPVEQSATAVERWLRENLDP